MDFPKPRTSNSLNEGLPIKMVNLRKIQRKLYFLMKKDRRFNTRIIPKNVFLIGQVPTKIRVENTVFALQHTGNRKSFTEVLPPPVCLAGNWSKPVHKLILHENPLDIGFQKLIILTLLQYYPLES